MLELICHQSYTWNGVPADKSPYRNHGSGINTDGAADGQEPGSGVITFPHPNSRVQIANGPAWQPLVSGMRCPPFALLFLEGIATL